VPANELAEEHADRDSDLALVVPAVVPDDAEERLRSASLSLVGRMQRASNATFLVRLDDGTRVSESEPDPTAEPWGLAIYKPERGERPLWDFESGLYRREVAAYRLGAAIGIDVVPPTVVRLDAPLGEGSLQWFVNADFSQHYFSLLEQRADLAPQFMDIAVFDVLANNTDRKSGHCLLEAATDRVWAIDNGLCFAAEFKLRTVIWEFAGDELPARLLAAVTRVADRGIPADVSDLLDEPEVLAIRHRAERLAAIGAFPIDRSGRGYPWPLV
jgi:uncharacterized repeat protein (TIGR03843 family)